VHDRRVTTPPTQPPAPPPPSPLTVQNVLALMPFAASIGVEITAVDKSEAVGTLAWAAERTTAGGVMHGGALMTLADSVGAVCAFLNLPPGTTTSTTSSSTVFVRGVRSGTVTATARPLHAGRSSIAVVTELRDDEGRLVAQVTQTQAVLAAR
jgi:1,4-dihydroxy-2-naphthoyl-CoA hydrolase